MEQRSNFCSIKSCNCCHCSCRLQREIHDAQLKVKKEMLGEIEAAKQEAEHQITTQRSEYEKEIKSLQSQLVRFAFTL